MLGAILVPGFRRREWGLAREVAALFGLAIPGFGASDCGCEGHRPPKKYDSYELPLAARPRATRPRAAAGPAC